MVQVRNATKSSVDTVLLLNVAREVLRREKRGNENVSIAIVSEKEMRMLSMIYKGKKKAANVLSFPFLDAQDKPLPELGLGEMVLCKKIIAKDAKKYGITEKRAMAYMTVHGILHLLGYSHKAIDKKYETYAHYWT